MLNIHIDVSLFALQKGQVHRRHFVCTRLHRCHQCHRLCNLEKTTSSRRLISNYPILHSTNLQDYTDSIKNQFELNGHDKKREWPPIV